jgi:hypothetical protein
MSVLKCVKFPPGLGIDIEINMVSKLFNNFIG